MPEVPIRDIWV